MTLWLSDFLVGRVIQVNVNGLLSDKISFNTGVPQGSVLSDKISFNTGAPQGSVLSPLLPNVRQ